MWNAYTLLSHIIFLQPFFCVHLEMAIFLAFLTVHICETCLNVADTNACKKQDLVIFYIFIMDNFVNFTQCPHILWVHCINFFLNQLNRGCIETWITWLVLGISLQLSRGPSPHGGIFQNTNNHHKCGFSKRYYAFFSFFQTSVWLRRMFCGNEII